MANWHKVYHFLLPTKKKETEAEESLKIWRGLSVMHISTRFLAEWGLLLIRPNPPPLPLRSTGSERNQISLATKVAIKAQPKIDQSAQCIQFWLFLQAYHKSSARSAAVYINDWDRNLWETKEILDEGASSNSVSVSGSCHFDRASNDEFSVECLFWFF